MLIKPNPLNEDQYLLKNNKKFFVINAYEQLKNEDTYYYAYAIIIDEEDIPLVLEQYQSVPCEIVTYKKIDFSIIKSYEIKNCTLYKIFFKDTIATVHSEDFIIL